MLTRRLGLSMFVCFACVFASWHVPAQEFPAKPIRFIVANTPGTLPDLVSRVMGPEMSKVLGQPVIVENKPGAQQLIGYEYVARQAPADGYTIVAISIASLASLPLTVKDLRFDPLKDLPPFMGLAEARYTFGLASQLPWKTFKELMAHAKANPGKLNYGASSPLSKLTMEAFLRDVGINVVHIPYSSTGAFLQAITSGDVHMVFLTEGSVISLGDKFRVLAVTGLQRTAAFPDVPTFAELGHSQIRSVGWSLNVRNGTPKAAIDKLYAAASQALKETEVRAVFAKMRLGIVAQPSDVAVKQLAEEAKRYAEVAKKAGIQPQ